MESIKPITGECSHVYICGESLEHAYTINVIPKEQFRYNVDGKENPIQFNWDNFVKTIPNSFVEWYSTKRVVDVYSSIEELFNPTLLQPITHNDIEALIIHTEKYRVLFMNEPITESIH